MRKWSFNYKSSPTEISKKLESEFESIGGFVVKSMNSQNDLVIFQVRKRFLYLWYWAYQNWTIVKASLKNNSTENLSHVEISFYQHAFIRIFVFLHFLLGISFFIPIVLGINNSAIMYLFGGVLLVLGIIFWFTLKRKFEKDIQKYKTLISRTL